MAVKSKALVGACLSLALLVGCESGPSNEELSDRISELEDENFSLRSNLEAIELEASEARDAAELAQSEAQSVSSQTERFQFEDWRLVVGDVQSAASSAERAAADAYNEASEVVDAIAY